MNQKELLKEALATAKYNQYTGKFLVTSDGCVWMGMDVQMINNVRNHAKSGVHVFLVNNEVTEPTMDVVDITKLPADARYSVAAVRLRNAEKEQERIRLEEDAKLEEARKEKETADLEELAKIEQGIADAKKAAEEAAALAAEEAKKAEEEAAALAAEEAKKDEEETAALAAEEAKKAEEEAAALAAAEGGTGKEYPMNAKDTIAAIKAAATIEEVIALIEGEERKSVLDAATNKHPELAR